MPLFEQWTVAAVRSLRRGHFFHFSSPPCQLIQVRSYWSTRYLSSSIIFTICMDWRKYRIIMIVPPESGAVDLHAFAYPDPAAFLMWIRIQLLKRWKNYLMKSYLSHICSWKKTLLHQCCGAGSFFTVSGYFFFTGSSSDSGSSNNVPTYFLTRKNHSF